MRLAKATEALVASEAKQLTREIAAGTVAGVSAQENLLALTPLAESSTPGLDI